MLAVASPLIIGHGNKLRSIRGMGSGMASAGFVVDKEA